MTSGNGLHPGMYGPKRFREVQGGTRATEKSKRTNYRVCIVGSKTQLPNLLTVNFGRLYLGQIVELGHG